MKKDSVTRAYEREELGGVFDKATTIQTIKSGHYKNESYVECKRMLDIIGISEEEFNAAQAEYLAEAKSNKIKKLLKGDD